MPSTIAGRRMAARFMAHTDPQPVAGV